MLNMLPASYNPIALIPAAHFYMPDYALGSLVLTRDQLRAYYPRGTAILEEEIAIGNGVKWTRSAAIGRVGEDAAAGEAEGDATLVTQGHCAFASLAIEIKEVIFGSTLSDHGGAFMKFWLTRYSTTLQDLLSLACTSKSFRAEVFAFITERTYVIAPMHFHTLFRSWSLPFMPASHAALIKQLNIDLGSLLNLNWLPYLSKKCMPNLQKLVIVWERIESLQGNCDQQTTEMAQYAALGRLGFGLKQICHRECSVGSSSCWVWEIVEGSSCDIVIQFSMQVSIVRPSPTGAITIGNLTFPGRPEYVKTQHCLIELTRNAMGSVLDNVLCWKIQTISDKEKCALLVEQDFH
ncbi:hypothetical protein DV738_g4279, partial [Chaetothyriales sp. CBS 135597]